MAEKPKAIPFWNNKGKKITIPAELTLPEVYELGVTRIKLEEPGTPLPDGWWSSERPKLSK